MMKTHGLVTALTLAVGIMESAFAGPSILIHTESNVVVQEDAFPQFDDATHFGDVAINGGIKSYKYLIHNRGDAVLNFSITGFYFSPAGWQFQFPPNSNLAPGSTTTLQINLAPTLPEPQMLRMIISTNDPLNPVYSYYIFGKGALFSLAKPDLTPGEITPQKTKITNKKGISYLTGSYLVPVLNVGDGRSDRLVPVIKVYSSSDIFLDAADTLSEKVYPIKKDLEPGATYPAKVKVKLPLLPSANHVIFQVSTPDDYESHYHNNAVSVPLP